MANELTLAVAGSGKTKGIADYCGTLSPDRRAVVVTFTQNNQTELRGRIVAHPGVEVMGWYTFLLRHFAGPFLPFKFPGERVRGFNYDGRPHFQATGKHRFLDAHGCAYGCELGRLSHELAADSKGALMRRLQCIYHEILIDEVQDLSSHDWEILDLLLDSSIDVRMVGDLRQAVLSTNARSSKNKKFEYAKSIDWFRERERRGVLTIVEENETWRCHPEIATFSDTIFDQSWTFPKTVSRNKAVTGHDGVFLVRSEHVHAYLEQFAPQCLRSSANSGKDFDLEYLNFRVAKGLTKKRVLIVPTEGITKFLTKGVFLKPLPASSFYVAVTRAQQSVAIVLDDAGKSPLPYWSPA